MPERIALIEGIRTPFCKAGGVLKEWEADDLGAFVVSELLARVPLFPSDIDELIFGNVIQPPHATNIARVVAVKGGLPVEIPAYTVNRNCASGMEAIVSGMNKLWAGEAEIILAGGTESMSNFPVLFSKKMREFLVDFSKAKSWTDKLKMLTRFRFSYLIPEIPAIADPLCSMTMGQTAELLARQFHITREEQDAYSLRSQQRALQAQKEGKFTEEIVPVPALPHMKYQERDDGVREDSSAEGLAKLKPAFDKLTGSVTAGNSSQVTDGAVAVLLMKESKAKELSLSPIGYIRDYSYAALEPSRMGLGPVFAIAKLLEKTRKGIEDIDLFEINEAFAAQVIAVEKALSCKEFARSHLNKAEPVGKIDSGKLNVNGGAVALGHPVGASGARIVLTLLKELRRRNKNSGIASLCVGGGQGEAVLVEVNS